MATLTPVRSPGRPAPPLAKAITARACPHKLGTLPCVNHRPHDGDGRGCVHHSTSGYPQDD